MILRRAYTDKGTFGKLFSSEREFICYTLERPKAGNKPYVSCIPEGDYDLVRHTSPKYGDVFALRNHENGVGINKGDAERFGILVHSANTVNQLQGCIAPGESLGVLSNEWAVLSSRRAYKKLFEEMTKDSRLIIEPETFGAYFKPLSCYF